MKSSQGLELKAARRSTPYPSRALYTDIMLRRRVLREMYSDIRDELFPESWSIDIDNWTRKRRCPVCKVALYGTHNCFKVHTEDFHDDWSTLVQPWVRWKGLRQGRVQEIP